MLFQKPFQPPEEIKEEYQKIVQNPMDLTTVKRKLVDGLYKNRESWFHDMCLIFDNAICYNGSDSIIGGVSIFLKKRVIKRYNELDIFNSRDFESKLIKLTRDLHSFIQTVPEESGITEEYVIEDDDHLLAEFTFERLQSLESSLARLCESGHSDTIISTISRTSPSFQFSNDKLIDVACLSRRTLCALEELCKQQASSDQISS